MGETLSTRLSARLHRLCPDPLRGVRLCVAYSGGLDSSVLLHALAAGRDRLGYDLSATHIHHGLNPRADEWARHCAQTCHALAVPFSLRRVDVSRDDPAGLEAAARAARYAALAEEDVDWIVLAHHRGDQAETVLHHLVRGTGVVGAAGMADRDAQRRLLRPFLDEARETLAAYAVEHGLRWIEDDSNRDTRFTRNFIRHRVLPVLKEMSPAAEANVARAAARFREAGALLAELAHEDAQRIDVGGTGSREALRNLSPARARNLLCALIREAGEQVPASARLEDLLGQLRGTAAVHLRQGDLAVCAWRDRFWLEVEQVADYVSVAWRGEARLPWGKGCVCFEPGHGNDALRLDPTGEVLLRGRIAGTALRVRPGGPRRAFKQLCQEADIPPWARASLPALCRGGQVLWVGALGSDAGVRCEAGEAGWRVRWVR